MKPPGKPGGFVFGNIAKIFETGYIYGGYLMELKPLKRIGTYEQYKLKKFKDLDNKLLARLHKEWPEGATHAVFQFGERINNEYKVTKALLAKYNVALIYSASPSRIKVKKVPFPETLKLGRVPATKLRLLFIKQSKDLIKKIKQLGPAFRKEHANALKLLKGSRNIGIYRGGRLVSLSISIRRKNYLGENCEWLLWNWTAPDLSAQEAAAEDETFFGFVKQTRLPVELKTRSFGQANQKLARARGFIPKYVTVAKMA